MLLWGWRRALAAALAGALAVLGQAPFDFMGACFLAFPVLVWLLDGATADRRRGWWQRFLPGFAIGWWFGLGYFTAGLWWLGNALLVEAESFAWALPLAVLGFPAFLALYYGFATALAHQFWEHELGRIAALAAAFGLAEFLRGTLFTGFPWNAIGYAAMPVPLLMQPVAAIGLYAVNALAVFVFAVPALLAGPRHRLAGGLMGLAIAAAFIAYGTWRLGLPEPEGTPLTVRIVQPSIDQAGKWDEAHRDESFRRHLELSAGGQGTPPQLVLWPETAVPFLFEDRPEALADIDAVLGEGQMLITGAVRVERRARPLFFNAALAIDEGGRIVAAADKLHLVPFGEYLPLPWLLERLGLRQLAAAPGQFAAAPARQSLQLPGGSRALPLICYEIIFPGEVEAGDADIIINLTNDAWYGDTPGPWQHFHQARVRAVETGLPLLRAANNGVSAVIDARGRMIEALALNQVGSIDATVVPGRFPVRAHHRRSLAAILVLFSLLAVTLHFRAGFHPN